MKTELYPSYDDYDVHLKESGLLVTPEGGSIAIIVHGVPYDDVLSVDKTHWPDKEVVSTKVFIDTMNVDKITLEIYEVNKN